MLGLASAAAAAMAALRPHQSPLHRPRCRNRVVQGLSRYVAQPLPEAPVHADLCDLVSLFDVLAAPLASHVAEILDRLKRKATAALAKDASRSFANWVRSAGSSLGPLHKWVRRSVPVVPPPPAAAPLEAAQNQAAPWAERWGHNGPQQLALARALGHLRQAPLAFEPLQLDDLSAAIRRPTESAPGADGLAPYHAKALPPQALEELRDMFVAWEAKRCLPAGLCQTRVAMLDKPESQDKRPISILAGGYRIWAAARGQSVARWQADAGPWFDDAVAESSALRAAVLRAVYAESASLLGLPRRF